MFGLGRRKKEEDSVGWFKRINEIEHRIASLTSSRESHRARIDKFKERLDILDSALGAITPVLNFDDDTQFRTVKAWATIGTVTVWEGGPVPIEEVTMRRNPGRSYSVSSRRSSGRLQLEREFSEAYAQGIKRLLEQPVAESDEDLGLDLP